ncbi:MAG: hypothetical protein ACI9OJ_002989 [Myxococcota bacterium]|jgi:hypothetical protein
MHLSAALQLLSLVHCTHAPAAHLRPPQSASVAQPEEAWFEQPGATNIRPISAIQTMIILSASFILRYPFFPSVCPIIAVVLMCSQPGCTSRITPMISTTYIVDGQAL